MKNLIKVNLSLIVLSILVLAPNVTNAQFDYGLDGEASGIVEGTINSSTTETDINSETDVNVDTETGVDVNLKMILILKTRLDQIQMHH